MQELLIQLNKLELDSNGNLKATIANLNKIAVINRRLVGIIVSDEYLSDLKKYLTTFRDVTNLQNQYWKNQVENFKPRSILKEIRNQAVADTVNKLTEAGIGVNIADGITNILKTNITTGGSYKQLEQQLRDNLMNNRTGEGAIEKYTKQITTDSLNQYSANYTQIVSSDLGAEWFQFQGTEIKTSRPICQAMHDAGMYFHISQVPNLLKGKDANGVTLEYTDVVTGENKKVGIYAKTGLPNGMIQGTNPENYFVRRNGYQCMHQFRPVLRESTVPLKFREMVYATPQYQAWKKAK